MLENQRKRCSRYGASHWRWLRRQDKSQQPSGDRLRACSQQARPTLQVSVDENGKIQYLNATIIEDDGCSHNENILSYTKDGFKNCYNYDNFSLNTGAVVTDLPSNTFARAPGATYNGTYRFYITNRPYKGPTSKYDK
ncbi:unnamed protein product [Leptidea sinapis]|uniref:Aldehyde oxidase/xanthine dehydrogenase first molybdopterin binding domain-containing protein n=1 Tax=Leptidea sinapis TaxID=189913 RepID=A0A5E4QMT5_9NEOP|nr:unnamed protein product [Leptidea sinapis]